MYSMKLVSVFVSVSVCMACWPIPKVDQTDYCFANLAYEATIESKDDSSENEIQYSVDVGKVYKTSTTKIPSTIKGHGSSNSCGPQKLEVGATYLIYASLDDPTESPQIVTYRKISDVTETDKLRMAAYDCSCEIVFDYDPPSVLPSPTSNQCNAPSDFCPRSGYCKRPSSDAPCAWKNLGECY